jgi:hypothetical protein
MKLIEILILSLAVVFSIIGIHLTMTVGVQDAYWAIMLSIALYFLFVLRKRKQT